MMKKIVVLILGIIFIMGIFTGCTSSTKKIGTAPEGSEIKIEAAAIKLVKDQSVGGYDLINVGQLKEWSDNNKEMVIIDVMPKEFYDKGHVPMAVNAVMPKKTIDDATKEEKDNFIKLIGEDKEKTIVVYCGFTSCGRSHVGASFANSLGYKNVYRMPGGIAGWIDGQNKVEK